VADLEAFPNIAVKSIHASVDAKSNTLNEATEGLVSEVSQAISQALKNEVETLKQASITASRSADALVYAKKFIGWRSIGINVVVMLAAFLLIKFVTPYMQPHRPTAEEQKFINYGKTLETVWPKLSPKTQQEIITAAKSGN
jgi:hypothetical protein